MPTADWGINAREIVDNFDWEKQEQFKPYTGPQPPLGVYKWRIARMKFDTSAETYPRWSALLHLVPRFKAEARFKGYRVWWGAYVGPDNDFAYVPMLTTLLTSAGVPEKQHARMFEQRTRIDEEGLITSIGKWRNDGKQQILGELTENTSDDGRVFRNIRWVGVVEIEEDDPEDDEAEAEDDTEDADGF